MTQIRFIMEDVREGVVKVKFSATEPMPENPIDMTLAQMVAAELSNWADAFFLIENGEISLEKLRAKYPSAIVEEHEITDDILTVH